MTSPFENVLSLVTDQKWVYLDIQSRNVIALDAGEEGVKKKGKIVRSKEEMER